MRLAAQDIVQGQERVCQERYAKDKEVTKLQSQVRVQWWLIALFVVALLADALKGVFAP